MPPTTARQFHIEACLGRGGFGEVYKARMVREGGFETRVALKLLRSDVDPRSQAAQRLRDEARMLGLVRHRAIPAVYDLVVLEGRLALVTAYVQGIDFGRALRSESPPSARACLEVGVAVADALDAAYHAPIQGDIARIVHRDLKPANIRIAMDGTPMLLDFGIAFTDAVTRVAETQSSALVGSPAYMAPERFEGTPPEPANDVFGLGAVLYEALVGRRLFGDVSFKTLAAISLFEDRYDRALDTRLAELDRDLPEQLHHLPGQMPGWAPARRPNAHEVARELEEIAAALPGETLARWCRARQGTPDASVEGAWVGRILTEGSDAGPTPVAQRPVAAEATPPTFPMDGPDLLDSSYIFTDETTAVVPRSVSPPPASRAGRTTVGLALAVLLGATGLWMTWPAAPAPTIEPAAPPVAAPEAPVADAPAPQPEVPESLPTAATSDPSPPPATKATAPRATATRPRVRAPEPALPRVDDLVPPEPEPEPEPEPVARIVAKSPPQPAPRPAVEPVTTKPQAAPAAPAAPPVKTTWVRVASGSNARRVQVAGDAGRFDLPAQVPAGSYRILAEFDQGIPQYAGDVVVVAGRAVEVRCANALCRAPR